MGSIAHPPPHPLIYPMLGRMRIVCGYIWGLWWWRTSPRDTRVDDCLCDVSSLSGCLDGMGKLKAAGLEGLRERGIKRGIPRNVPVDLITNQRKGHAPSSLCVRHRGQGDLPPASLSRVGDGIYVCTPAVCLLQVASVVTKRFSGEIDSRFCIVIVAQVACELCGQYSLTADGECIRRKPLLTLGDLFLLVAERAGSYGVNLLGDALRWVIENTRSPKEVAVFLLLCLPPRLGGFGLPRPRSNYDINVRAVRTGLFATWITCNVDFYWGQAHLVVEYDSRTYHDDLGPAKTSRDAERADALRELGYTVVTIRRDDLYNPRLFREKAQEIAEALSYELPPGTAEFRSANGILRNMLLRHDRWV